MEYRRRRNWNGVFCGRPPIVVGNEDSTLYAIWSEFGFDLGSGTVTGFGGTGTGLVIPSAINTVQVTGIGSAAFAGNALTSITIPAGVNIAGNNAMGVHGASFLAFYNATGRRAGIYTFANGQWTFYRDVAFTITFADLRVDIDVPITVAGFGLLDRPFPQIEVANPGQFDEGSIRWFIGDSPIDAAAVDGSQGERLTLDSHVHFNRRGTHRITLEVEVDGVRYGRVITFTVTL